MKLIESFMGQNVFSFCPKFSYDTTLVTASAQEAKRMKITAIVPITLS